MANATKLGFEVVLSDGTSGGPDTVSTVITSEAAWAALGVKAELPEVDFQTHSLLVFTVGQRPDQAYTLGIVDVLDLEPVSGAKVAWVLFEERNDGPPADMLANPIVVAKVARTGHHFLFARR
ncbi:MAG: hypothetical protein M3Y59_04870 [Myxococcota bacterium]|nr:hypothetical protein [Myxococcota bacterium]